MSKVVRKTFNIASDVWATLQRRSCDVTTHLGVSYLTESQLVGYVLTQGLAAIPECKERKKESSKERKKESLTDSPGIPNWTEKIQELKTRLGNPALVDRALEAIASTRTNGTLADSVVYGILCKWATVEPMEALFMGLEKYLDRSHAADGKRENYLWGVIRGCARELEAGPPKGGNGKPKPPDPTIPDGYPADIYDRKRWYWSEQARGYYPVNQYGKPDFAAQHWAWVEGMKKP